MNTLLSDIIKSANRKKKKKSPLSETYSKFMNHQNIKLSPSNSVKPVSLDNIRINVIKNPEIHKIPKKKPCKRERVIKNGVVDEKAILANKKCEEKVKEEKVKEEKVKEEKVKEEKVKEEKVKEEKVKVKGTGKMKSKRKKKSKRKSKTFKRKKKSKSAKKEMEKAKELSDEFIKQELLKKGIEIKGNQKQLMRDIYVFSNMGGIKVRKA